MAGRQARSSSSALPSEESAFICLKVSEIDSIKEAFSAVSHCHETMSWYSELWLLPINKKAFLIFVLLPHCSFSAWCVNSSAGAVLAEHKRQDWSPSCTKACLTAFVSILLSKHLLFQTDCNSLYHDMLPNMHLFYGNVIFLFDPAKKSNIQIFIWESNLFSPGFPIDLILCGVCPCLLPSRYFGPWRSYWLELMGVVVLNIWRASGFERLS